MSYQLLRGNARKDILKQAKRQMFKKEVELREDTRPVDSISELYRQINEELFDGTLPNDLPVVYNYRLRRTLGQAYYRYDRAGEKVNLVPTKIEIRGKHRWTARFLRKVMTHEMCHVWAYQEHNEEGHGKHFWRKMKELGYPNTHDWDDSLGCERDIYC